MTDENAGFARVPPFLRQTPNSPERKRDIFPVATTCSRYHSNEHLARARELATRDFLFCYRITGQSLLTTGTQRRNRRRSALSCHVRTQRRLR